jgi:hypothetical protein
MLIPRFTVRWLLLLVTACGVFSAVVACAVRGQLWALAVSLGVASLTTAFIWYGAFFGFAYVLALLFGALDRPPRGGSPFITAAPPPQILPPDQPDAV